jgi:hypothetical protein
VIYRVSNFVEKPPQENSMEKMCLDSTSESVIDRITDLNKWHSSRIQQVETSGE